MTDRHLAFMTFSILRAPYGNAIVQDFDDRTPGAFAEAEKTDGFIDRARPVEDVPWMTNFQKDWGRWGPFAVPRFYLGGTTAGHTYQAQTLSVWRDLRAVWMFAYRGPIHSRALRDREDWFGPQNWPIYCAWWIDAGHQATWPEACARLEHLHDHGPTPTSFTLKVPFDAEGRPARLGRAAAA
jgi:hypothetical protein